MTTDEGSGELHYVIRTVDGARHAGWYRLTGEHRLEVISEGHRVTVPAAEGSLEDQARQVLKEIVTHPDEHALVSDTSWPGPKSV